MIYFLSKAPIKNAVNGLLMSIMLSGAACPMNQFTPANQIEMGLAVATVPFDIAAHYYDFTENKKTAAFLHLTTNTISILNKMFFFGNYIQGHVEAGSAYAQDSIINAAWLARDVTKFYLHLKAYQTQKNAIEAPQEELAPKVESNPLPSNDDLFLAFGEAFDEELKSEEISRLAYTCQVVVLPVLRGASAAVLAWSQGTGTIQDFNGKNARLLASSLHSLIRLSEEYTELDSKSPYKKLCAVALIASVAWLAKELSDYSVAYQLYQAEQERLRNQRLRLLGLQPNDIDPFGEPQQPQNQPLMQQIRHLRGEDAQVLVGDAEQAEWQDLEALVQLNDEQAVFDQQLQRGNVHGRLPVVPGPGQCTVCLDDQGERRRLACGHDFCMDCLNGHVADAIDERQAHINCPNRDCQHQVWGIDGMVQRSRPMEDGDIRAIIQANNQGNQALMNRYDQIRQRGQRGARLCPTDGCPHVFGNRNNVRINGYGCPECNQRYCANCTVPHAPNISCMRARIEADAGTRAWLDESENRTLCPGCFTPCERQNACPQMQCTEARCRREFCLYCHLDNMQHAQGCPRRGFDPIQNPRDCAQCNVVHPANVRCPRGM